MLPSKMEKMSKKFKNGLPAYAQPPRIRKQKGPIKTYDEIWGSASL